MACIDGKVCHLDKDHLDFFVLGDTGGLGLDLGPNYLNFIKSTEVQERLAKTMADLAGKQRPEFIINTGDNVSFKIKRLIQNFIIIHWIKPYLISGLF